MRVKINLHVGPPVADQLLAREGDQSLSMSTLTFASPQPTIRKELTDK
jgi:hypothetical protein